MGQGDAILVEGDRGARMLIDGGPDPDRLILELDARIPPWDRRIDVLILSHPHEDHAGGLPRLIDELPDRAGLRAGMVGPGPGLPRLPGWTSPSQGRTPELLSTGDRLRLDSIDLQVLWPDRDAVPRDPPDGGTSINNVSIVLLGTFGAQRFLLAGDIEQEIDPILLARGLPRVDLLKVAHHGSRTSSTDAFLDAVRPRVAIVSVGAVNPYGHPAPETLERIEARGARLYRTDRNGTVEATLDGRSLVVAGRARRSRPRQESRQGPPWRTLSDQAPRWAPGTIRGAIAAFRCGIVAPRLAGPQAAVRSPARASAAPAASEDRLYHRADVHPDQGRGGGTAPLDRSVAARPAPRAGGRRGRRLARPADQRPRDPREPAGGRGCRAPARRRQGAPQAAAARSPDPRPPPR